MNRVIVLIDMDCFYCQVEVKLNPSLRGKPIAVAQRTESKDRPFSRIIAVNYEAKNKGVSRHMLATEAKTACPDIEIVGVTQSRGKADLNRYRDASKLITDVLLEFCPLVEKASVDEAYLDITEIISKQVNESGQAVTESQLYNTYIIGYESDENSSCKSSGVKEFLYDAYRGDLKDVNLLHLALAALFVQEIRETIYSRTEFRCSAGIAHNKMLAKIACGLHKPNCQTVLPHSGVPVLYKTLPIKKVRNCGGQFGELVMKELNCSVMADVTKFTLKDLEKKFPQKTAQWLFEVSRGIDLTPVKYRMISNSISCCKRFPGQSALKTKASVQLWINELCAELKDRLDKDESMNKRRGTLLVVRYQHSDNQSTVLSRSTQLPSYDFDKVVKLTEKLLSDLNKSTAPDSWLPPFSYLGVCVSKFNAHHGGNSIRNFMKPKISSSLSEAIPEPALFSAFIHPKATNCKSPSLNFADSECNITNNHPTLKSCWKPADLSNSFFVRYFKNNQREKINEINSNNVNIGTVNFDKTSPIVLETKQYCTIENDNYTVDCGNELDEKSLDDKVINNGSGYDGSTVLDSGENAAPSSDGKEVSETTENFADGFYEVCPYCQERVIIVDFQSHLDYHIALEFQETLNSSSDTTSTSGNNSNTVEKTFNNKKRKLNGKKKIISPQKSIRDMLFPKTSKLS